VATKESTNANFGLLIAYVLPGFTAIHGWPFLSHPLSAQALSANESASLAGFLDGTVEAITAGLTVSAIRWLVLDSIHHRTGLRPPRWDFALLDRSASAFELLIHMHYRYYKFYGNMVIALLWTFAVQGYTLGRQGLVYPALACLFFMGSRDALAKYYWRAGQLLSGRVMPVRDVSE
jgi:hypothetical protein